MKDNTGIFYYPLPANKQIKMYVRENDAVVEFRLHNENDPQLWQEHGWITFEMAKQAAQMYSGHSDPLRLYDFEVALNLINQEKNRF